MTKPSDLARFLPEPEIEKIPGAGTEACYIRLQAKGRQAVKTLQPDPSVLVYLFVDSDNLPVGIKILQPTNCVVLLRLVKEGVRHYVLTEPTVIAQVLAGLEKYGEEFLPPSTPCSRQHEPVISQDPSGAL